jgi:2-polyprenyl-3-methyl-5-hydroxy-6-metoxy-1,4-benzoquinol methylase
MMNPRGDESAALPLPEILSEMKTHIYQVAILRAALELGVWEKVAAGEDNPEVLASAHHWHPLATRLLLNDLCSLELLAQEGNRYRLVPEAESYLLPDKPSYMGKYLLSTFGWEGNGQLAEAIRTGNRRIGYNATRAEVIDVWIGMYAGLVASPETYLDRWDGMWEELGIEPRDGLEILDVACGPVPRSFALARTHPSVHVTLLDWEQVLTIAGRLAADLGVQNQVTLLSGDLWTVPYPSLHYDVVYLGNIAHFFSPEQNTRLFLKARKALVQGGTVVVNGIRRENHDPADLGLWYFAVSEGAAYDFQEYKDMLERAGFSDIVDVSTQPIKATKR